MSQAIPLGLGFDTSTEKGVSLSKDKYRFSCMKTQHLLNYGDTSRQGLVYIIK